MSSDPGFQVQADAIAAHADTLDEVAGELTQGRSAAATVSMGPEAYGILCRIIPSLLEPLQDATITALAEATDLLESSADDLRTTARDYADSDRRTADTFRGDRPR